MYKCILLVFIVHNLVKYIFFITIRKPANIAFAKGVERAVYWRNYQFYQKIVFIKVHWDILAHNIYLKPFF